MFAAADQFTPSQKFAFLFSFYVITFCKRK